ncbi:hypothetical protein NYA9BBAC_02590 [Salinibacterium sp. NYA9b]
MSIRSQHTSRIATPAGVLLIAASFLLSSCSTGTVGLESSGVDIEPYAHVTATLDFEAGTVVLPVDAINRNAPQVDELRREAWQVLTDACLAESGLPGYSRSETVSSEEDRLFGLWSVPLAQKYGFEIAALIDQVPPTPSDEELRCLDESKEEMRTRFNLDDGYSFDAQVADAAYDAAFASEPGQAALAAAKECMVEQGLEFDAESPMPQFDYESDGDSAENRRIAVIEATCNVETGAIQTLYDLTARYQSALMDANEAEAQEAAEVVATRIAGFEGVISASE